MYYLLNVLLFITICRVNSHLFDRYSGKKVDVAQSKEFLLKNATDHCTILIKPCTPHEGSRIDGTCNNLKYPTRGSARGPYLRLLKPDYGNNNKIRLNKHGEPLPSARKVRTELHTDGRVEDRHKFNAAVFTMLEFVHKDISYMTGSLDYLRDRQHCCTPAGETDPRCIPIRVPADDPYLKVTDIRCLNFSRAETFQDAKCTPEIILPEQINFQTPVLDLSTIYGVDNEALRKVRKYEYGLLILEKRQNRYVPQNMTTNMTKDDNKKDIENNSSTVGKKVNAGTNYNKTETDPPEILTNVIPNVTKTPQDNTSNLQENTTASNQSVCIGNNDTETICYQFGYPEAGNFDLRTTVLTILFMREHNRIAQTLHQMNPCWTDDRLFKIARQINIGTASNIFTYELLPALLGFRNLVNYGLLSENVEHVKHSSQSFIAQASPLVYAEFDIAIRYFHTLIDGRVKTYREDYHYMDEYSYSDTLFRSGLLEKGKILEEVTRGIFQQYAAKMDDIQDPEISENYYGKKLQRAHDLIAIDIQRSRDLGIRGYNDYRHLCGLKPAHKFEDFLDVMEVEKVESLKKLYEVVDDVDLLAGIMSENDIQGIHVGPTLFCIMTKQLELFRFADRFWFERGDQEHSFSLRQLHEIRKTNMARFVCDNADGIKFIQPQAFINVKPGNMPVPCTHIEGPDLTKWRDDTCYKHKYNQYNHIATHTPSGYSKQKNYYTTSTFYGNNRDAVQDFSSFFDNLLSKPEEEKVSYDSGDKRFEESDSS